VADVLSQEVSHCDLIARRNDHFIMLLPETDREGANALARRLKETVEARLGLNLQAGTACFPEQEVTFTGLLERAELEMRRENPDSERQQDFRLVSGS
jgi:GGDEF domain-containing protein